MGALCHTAVPQPLLGIAIWPALLPISVFTRRTISAKECRSNSLNHSDRQSFVAVWARLLPGIRRFAGDWSDQIFEGVRRIVVNIMLGNGDAHLKNWSFLLDGARPRLTPAYDLVPTFLYGDQSMALKFGGTSDPAKVTLCRFERAASLMKVAPDLVVGEVRRTTERILNEWPKRLHELPLRDNAEDRIIDRWKTFQLVDEVAPRYFNLAPADEPG